jgi:hypothetical protein
MTARRASDQLDVIRVPAPNSARPVGGGSIRPLFYEWTSPVTYHHLVGEEGKDEARSVVGT